MNRRRIVIGLACLALAAGGAHLLLGCGWVSQGWAASQVRQRPAKIPVTISRETTYLTGPLNSDGTVNYVAAMDEIYSKGVTPANNAVVPLVQAFGPRCLLASTRAEVLRRLGIAELPEQGDYFQDEPADLADYKAKEQFRNLLNQVQARPTPAKDVPAVADWIRSNDKPLALIVSASTRPRLYLPWLSSHNPPDLNDGSSPSFRAGNYRRAVWALVVRANLRAAGGELDSALDDLAAVHRLARLAAQTPALIHYLMALPCDGKAHEAETELARTGKLSAAQARKHLAFLQALPPLPSLADAFDGGERLYMLDYWSLLVREGLDSQLRPLALGREDHAVPDVELDLDELLRLENCHQDERVRCARLSPWSVREKAASELENRKPLQAVQEVLGANEGTNLLVGTPPGKVFNQLLDKVGTRDRKLLSRAVYELMGAMSHTTTLASTLYTMAARHQVRSRQAELALALCAYRQEKGRYPQQLSDLSPGWIKTVPGDVFDDEKPMRYQPKGNGYVLYSIGPNLRDDGGNHDEAAGANASDDTARDDIAVKGE